jgi:hypothetical protein
MRHVNDARGLPQPAREEQAREEGHIRQGSVQAMNSLAGILGKGHIRLLGSLRPSLEEILSDPLGICASLRDLSNGQENRSIRASKNQAQDRPTYSDWRANSRQFSRPSLAIPGENPRQPIQDRSQGEGSPSSLRAGT